MEFQQDLLEDVENEVQYERVSPGMRFVNYLVDLIAFYALTFMAGYILGSLGLVTKQVDYYTGTTTINGEGTLYLVVFAILIGYYTISEGALKGKTLGKLVTGCKAVKEDGTPITLTTAFLRTLCRFIPFEPFSAFSGNPWHDKWTKTQVVKIRR